MILGITGKYCSGKNHISSILEKKGYHIIDVDKLGHSALKQEEERVISRFGREILTEGGQIDRKKLGSIVFSDPEALRDLEALIHPVMVEAARVEAEQLRSSGVVINAAILFKMQLHRLCDLVIWVEAPLLERFFRALKRDDQDIRKILSRIWAQRGLRSQLFKDSVDIYKVRNSRWAGSPVKELDKILSGNKRPL